MGALWRYLKRWQEFLGWLPALALLSLVAYVVLGALLRHSPDAALGALIELPAIAAYAGAAAGFTYLSWRRFRIQRTQEQLDDYWDRLMAGQLGAVVVFIVNALVYLACFALWLHFFSPPR